MNAAVLAAAVALVVGDALQRTARSRWRLPSTLTMARWPRRAALVVLIGAAAAVAPALPLLVAVGWWTRRRVAARRAQLDHAAAVRRSLPEVVDLLALASTAGVSLPVAHPLVARSAPSPVGPALLAADLAAAAGRPRADALLDHLSPLGDRAHALAQVLVDHLRYGVPLLPALERSSLEMRLDRRRAAELEARRVPVRLLGPLVLCVLPAFALLTVVPLLAASLEALPT
jgi:tight adherence protein C